MSASRQRHADVRPTSGRSGTPIPSRHCSVIGVPMFALCRADMTAACLRSIDVGPTWHVDAWPTLSNKRHVDLRPTSDRHVTPTSCRYSEIIGIPRVAYVGPTWHADVVPTLSNNRHADVWPTLGRHGTPTSCRHSEIIGMPTFGLRRADMARRRFADAVK